MSEREYMEKIKDKLSQANDDIEYPKSITPENIVQLAENQKKSNKRRKAFSFASAAAVIAVFLVCGVLFSTFSSKLLIGTEPAPITENDIKKSSEYVQEGAKDYNEIYKVIKSSRNQSTSNGNFIDRIDDFIDGFSGRLGSNFVHKEMADFGTATEESNVTLSSGASETNVQVDGVDEGDIIKNDDRYIYKWNAEKNSIVVFDALDVNNVKQINNIEILKSDEHIYSKEMYLNDNKLTVVYSYYEQMAAESELDSEMEVSDDSAEKIAIDMVSIGEEKTCVIVYDVTNPEHEVVMRRFTQDGSFNSTRMIESYLVIISTKWITNDISKESTDTFVPKVMDSAVSDSEKVIDARCVILPETITSESYTIVSVVDTNSAKAAASTKATLGGSGTVYATTENIYVMASNYHENGIDTDIQRFSLSDGEIKATGSVSVNGHIINQFAIDEYNGFLRVATTITRYGTGFYSDKVDTSNALFVFDSDLKVVGSLLNIAPDEQIYSVRYQGEKAYMVTFRTVDPLFSIDLSDPYNPVITGELKIPGFSNYMHPVTENLMLGFGKDADEETGQVENGIKISLFDVSDSSQPIERDVLMAFEDYISAESSVCYNHKALVDLGGQMYGFPVFAYDQSWNYYGYFAVIKVDGEKVEMVKIIDGHKESEAYYDDEIRGVRIGDALITINNNNVIVTSLLDFTEVSNIEIE